MTTYALVVTAFRYWLTLKNTNGLVNRIFGEKASLAVLDLKIQRKPAIEFSLQLVPGSACRWITTKNGNHTQGRRERSQVRWCQKVMYGVTDETSIAVFTFTRIKAGEPLTREG